MGIKIVGSDLVSILLLVLVLVGRYLIPNFSFVWWLEGLPFEGLNILITVIVSLYIVAWLIIRSFAAIFVKPDLSIEYLQPDETYESFDLGIRNDSFYSTHLTAMEIYYPKTWMTVNTPSGAFVQSREAFILETMSSGLDPFRARANEMRIENYRWCHEPHLQPCIKSGGRFTLQVDYHPPLEGGIDRFQNVPYVYLRISTMLGPSDIPLIPRFADYIYDFLPFRTIELHRFAQGFENFAVGLQDEFPPEERKFEI